jgi:LacI family transcriptional regulator
MPVTLKNIAEHVGKSVTTVSRALAGFDDVSPRTREEVRRVAQELGYEPNFVARSLQKQRTDTISLILPSDNLKFSDPFLSMFLSGIVEQATRLGFNLAVSVVVLSDERETYLRHIRGRRVDGFIVIRTRRQDGRIELLREHGVPFVAFGRIEGDNDFPLVDEDGAHGIRQVVDHLAALGHERLACLAEPSRFTKSYHRVKGFLEGLHAHHLPDNPGRVIETNYRQRSGWRATRQLLDRPNPPTAIVACNDLLALGAMRAVQERGLAVGRDVSVTGFDDIPLAAYINPPLTTVRQPAHRMGKLVAQMLIHVINHEPIVEPQIILKPTLVVRQSSGPPPDREGA